MTTMFLPDINLWLALTFDSHVHHAPAKTWFDGLSSGAVCVFCRLTQIGFLRLASSKKAFGKHALKLPDAWQTYDTFLTDPRIAEPVDLEIHWRNVTQHQSYSPKVWNDAYLAAFAVTGNLELVTFDKAMTQYANVKCVLLS